MTEHDAAPSLDRPDLHTELGFWECAVAGSPDRVFALLVPEITPADGTTGFAAYPQARTAVLQGGWWYRGEYRVTATDDGGSLITYTIVNVAQKRHRMSSMVARGTVEAAPKAFARHVQAVVAGLDQG